MRTRGASDDTVLRVQYAFMTQTGKVGTGFGTFCVTSGQKRFRVMIRFPGGDPFLAENAFSTVLWRQRFMVIVVTVDHTSAPHVKCGLNTPVALLTTVTHPGLVA